ncbi:hypothetical protein LDO32_18060 [Luteimonas sp. Y-2-2-4F]|nr:hypothetical protein [Luteimonas sp. Y-2-2-4F]MCD9033620.1 hypothetical protein [Luteimonas sp. Y-2-2-4F]
MKTIMFACALALSALPGAAALASGPPATPCTADLEGEYRDVRYPRYFEVYLCSGGTWQFVKRCLYDPDIGCLYG